MLRIGVISTAKIGLTKVIPGIAKSGAVPGRRDLVPVAAGRRGGRRRARHPACVRVVRGAARRPRHRRGLQPAAEPPPHRVEPGGDPRRQARARREAARDERGRGRDRVRRGRASRRQGGRGVHVPHPPDVAGGEAPRRRRRDRHAPARADVLRLPQRRRRQHPQHRRVRRRRAVRRRLLRDQLGALAVRHRARGGGRHDRPRPHRRVVRHRHRDRRAAALPERHRPRSPARPRSSTASGCTSWATRGRIELWIPFNIPLDLPDPHHGREGREAAGRARHPPHRLPRGRRVRHPGRRVRRPRARRRAAGRHARPTRSPTCASSTRSSPPPADTCADASSVRGARSARPDRRDRRDHHHHHATPHARRHDPGCTHARRRAHRRVRAAHRSGGADLDPARASRPVPITGQTFAVLLAGGTLGAWRGASSQLLYVALGAIGLPFYADGDGGWTAATGATGGYLVGFVVAAGDRRLDGRARPGPQGRRPPSRPSSPAAWRSTPSVLPWLSHKTDVPFNGPVNGDNALAWGLVPVHHR